MNELFNYFDSVEFSSKLNVCSGFKTVINGLKTEENLSKLIKMMDSPRNQVKVYNKICELAKDGGSEVYEHQYDVAITVYLYALGQCNMALAMVCCEQVKNTTNCFWVWKMVAELTK